MNFIYNLSSKVKNMTKVNCSEASNCSLNVLSELHGSALRTVAEI